MSNRDSNLHSKWEVVTFEEIGDFLRGPFGSSVKKSVCVSKAPNTFKLYEQGNVIQNDFNRGDYYITKERFNQLHKFELLSGDIVITCAGTLGKIALVPEGIERGIINSVLMRIRLDNSRVLTKYFLYYFQSPQVQDRIYTKSSGATIKNLFATKKLKSFRIPLPPITVQKQIVAILDKAEEIKTARKQANLMANNLLQASFLKIFGDPLTNTKFKLHKISELTSLVSYGFTRPMPHFAHGIPIITSKNVSSGEIDFCNVDYTDKESFTELSKKDCPTKGDILYTKDGRIGEAATVETDSKFCISQAVAILRPLKEKIDPLFLEILLNTTVFRNKVRSMAYGVALKHISITKLKQIPIIAPPMEIQERFVGFVRKIKYIKDKQKESSNEIQGLFNSLMAKAFKGELLTEAYPEKQVTEQEHPTLVDYMHSSTMDLRHKMDEALIIKPNYSVIHSHNQQTLLDVAYQSWQACMHPSYI